MASTISIKREVLKLLKEDEEFRYAVAGLLGLEEILKRLDKHDSKFVKILERLDQHDAKFVEILKMLERHEKELVKLREDMIAGFRRHDEEIAKLREDMIAGFKRHDEILERHEKELVKLREDMNRGFELVERHISALGARWGMMSEEAFREGLRGVLSEELGLRVDRWIEYDDAGKVYGYPSNVEIDVAVKDGKVILIEVSSHIRASDIFLFKRKAKFYEEKTKRRPDRLLVITPYAEESAYKASKELGIEVYTKV